ncbi:histidine phosphatase family protein [Thiocystis minor]|uniref:histidine phosphatase family protein n=1 Tax=Thiocystis minor TaxID=61597 RepID=UPI001913951D|nr:histidine phosphatase family protein [Thiocystis minor]
MAERFLDLLRHGEVQGGTRFRGDRDDPLSPLGWEQMRLATSDLTGWTRILSSPSRRCVEFARELADGLGLPIEARLAFRERGFGAWEGLAVDQIPAEALHDFWADPVGYTPPDAETFTAFRARVLDGWRALRSEPDPHSLLVTHGGVIRILAAEVLRMSEDAFFLFEVPHASRTRLRIPDPPWRTSLVFHRSVPPRV